MPKVFIDVIPKAVGYYIIIISYQERPKCPPSDKYRLLFGCTAAPRKRCSCRISGDIIDVVGVYRTHAKSCQCTVRVIIVRYSWDLIVAIKYVVLVTCEHSAFGIAIVIICMYLEDLIPSNFDRTPDFEIKCFLR